MKIGRIFSWLGAVYAVIDFGVRRLGDADFIVGLFSSTETNPHWIIKGINFIRQTPESWPYSIATVGILFIIYDFWKTRRNSSKEIPASVGESAGRSDHLKGGGHDKTEEPANGPDYEQWDKSEILNLWNAAHLWADLEPSHYVDHPGGPPPFYQIFSELKAAVDRGDFQREGPQINYDSPPAGYTSQANRHTTVKRRALRVYATQIRKDRPRFLFPDEREGFNRRELGQEDVTTLYGLAGVLQSLFDWGSGIREGDDPSEWLSKYVDIDEDTINQLAKKYPRYIVDDYITASKNFGFPSSTPLHGDVVIRLQRLCGKIGSLRDAAASIVKANHGSMP